MNLKSLFIISAAAAALAACQTNIGSKSVRLTNTNDSASYALGVLIGENNKMQLDMMPGNEDLNKDIMITAFAQQMQGVESKITTDEAQRIVQEFFENASKRVAEKNAAEGQAFLEKNKQNEGVITTESGLQYMILIEGDGPRATADQMVKVHYHGTLIDGTVFDSSVDRGEPVTFGVSHVIPGWTEALLLMPAGSKWKVFIPSDLGYGERGAGSVVGPNATLIFEVELLEIIEE